MRFQILYIVSGTLECSVSRLERPRWGLTTFEYEVIRPLCRSSPGDILIDEVASQILDCQTQEQFTAHINRGHDDFLLRV